MISANSISPIYPRRCTGRKNPKWQNRNSVWAAVKASRKQIPVWNLSRSLCQYAVHDKMWHKEKFPCKGCEQVFGIHSGGFEQQWTQKRNETCFLQNNARVVAERARTISHTRILYIWQNWYARVQVVRAPDRRGALLFFYMKKKDFSVKLKRYFACVIT